MSFSRPLVGAVAVMAIVAAGCASLARGPRPARLVGTLWWVTPDQVTQPLDAWRTELDDIQALGMDLMVLNGPFVGQDLPDNTEDPLIPFFEELDRRGMRVYLDTLFAPQWWTLKDPATEIERARERIALLHERYGRFRCFEGFYVPYELYVFWGDHADLIRTLYREVAAACKATAPDKPVMISPFFILDREGYLGSFRYASPEEYEAFWASILAESSIDIVALQDSGEHLSFYTLEERAPFFQAMKNACGATDTELWANIETGELHVAGFDDYVARFGMKTHVNDPKTQPYWRAAPADKLVRKLAFAGRYTPTAITWGYREFIRPALGPDAKRIHGEYATVLGE